MHAYMDRESQNIQLITPPARRVWRSFKMAPFLFFFHVERWATAHG